MEVFIQFFSSVRDIAPPSRNQEFKVFTKILPSCEFSAGNSQSVRAQSDKLTYLMHGPYLIEAYLTDGISEISDARLGIFSQGCCHSNVPRYGSKECKS